MGGGRGGGSNNGGTASIPVSSKKMIQSVKEIVNCSEVEIYTMLKDCNMDPNETVNRLLSQDPFREVKSKREKKKENKDVVDSRPRGTSNTSNRGGRVGVDRVSSRGSAAQFGSSDSGASRGKLSYKRDSGPTAYSSSATGMVGSIMSRRQPPVSDVTTDKIIPASAAESITTAHPSPGLQPTWGGMAGHVSMADIVKMGRPQGRASSSVSTSQQHVNNQQNTVNPGLPGPQDLPPSQNYAVKDLEMNPPSGIMGNQHVPPNDDDWNLEVEPPAASFSSVVEPSVDLEPYDDHYDRTNQHFRLPSDEVRYVEDDVGDAAHSNFVQSAPDSHQNPQDGHSGSVTDIDSDLYHNINSYQVHHQEVEDASGAVSSLTTNFQNISLPEESEDSPSEDDGPAVKIPDHLQVQSTDCSHLSFGSFGSGVGAPFSGSFTSGHVISNDEEVSVGADAQSVGHTETRNSEYYEDEHHRSASNGNDDSAKFDGPSVPQPNMSEQDILKQEAPEVAHGNQYSFSPSTANYAFENSQQSNASYAHPQTGSQMQGAPTLSMPYSNSLPSTLLAPNVQLLRESELAYSPFAISQSMPTKYNNSISSITGPSVSIAEAMKTGNMSGAQPTQTPQGGNNVSGGHALPQQLLHPYNQPSVPMGPFATSMLSYPYLPQNYPYMPSAFQQAFAAGNSNYAQSLAAVLPQYKNNVSVTSMPQSATAAPGYGAAFGNSNNIPSNFPLNPPAAPAGTSVNYDDVLSSQYKDASHLLSLQQGLVSRTISGVPGSTYYSFQGQNQQQAAGFRQNQQQMSQQQHYGGPLSGYPNYFPSQGGPTLEQQLQMSREASLGGSQGGQQQQQQQSKQNAPHLWQNSY